VSDLVKIEKEMAIIDTCAEAIFDAGLGCTSPAQAKVIAAIALSEGRNPLSSFRYEFVQNRPTKKPVAMLEDYMDLKGYIEIVEQSDTKCIIDFYNPNEIKPKRTEFSIEEAKELFGDKWDKKDNYKKQPATMLYWRCLAKGFRFHYPKVTHQIYTPDELGGEVVLTDDDIIVPDVFEESDQVEMEAHVDELAESQNKDMIELIDFLDLPDGADQVTEYLIANNHIEAGKTCYQLSFEDSSNLLIMKNELKERLEKNNG
jgi:hypothetical protein